MISKSATILLLSLLLWTGCTSSDKSEETQGDDGVMSQRQEMPGEDESSNADNTSEIAAIDSSVIQILFLGDSITAGLGVNREEAFPVLVEQSLLDAGFSVNAIEGGVSGDTSTGGLNRMDWLLQNRVDILFLELGGNDGLRGIDLNLTRSNLGAIIEVTRERFPDVQVVVAGMIVPPNLGHEYTAEFTRIFPSVSEEYGTFLIPFIGTGLVGVDGMVQNDGIHPTSLGHQLIAETVYSELVPILTDMQRD